MLSSLFNGIDYPEILSWFSYNPEDPLLFSSSLFWGFFLIFYIIYIATKKHAHFRNLYVVAFSLFFYYKAGGCFFILLVISTLVNYILSEAMDLSSSQRKRKIYLIVSVIANLLLLGYYKYTNFFIENVNSIFSSNFALQHIILPVGISFYTFQAISYLVDLYKREIKPARSLLDFAFYACFFPQLVAGPIVRAKDFLPQMYRKIELNAKDTSLALYLILIGLVKKSVISDYISLNFVDRVFDAPLSYTAFENLMATYGYTLQIYCDFSGYSDMAIGLALLMGFTLPENFKTPYKSRSVTEFWRRWHISLSSWLRDYLYIPLGGSRKGKFRTYLNLFTTMIIGGLWHGAAWKFIAWGALHGGALVVERFFQRFIKVKSNILTRSIGVILTFHFVSFCWIFFRAENFEVAKTVITTIGTLEFDWDVWMTIIDGYQNILILMAIGYFFHFLPTRVGVFAKSTFEKMPFPLKAIIIGLVFWLVYATASSGPQPFIYFQF